jgi:hypothetical protein
VRAFVWLALSSSSCSSFLSISRRHPRSMCSLEVGGGDKNCASSPDGGKRQNMADGSCDGARAACGEGKRRCWGTRRFGVTRRGVWLGWRGGDAAATTKNWQCPLMACRYPPSWEPHEEGTMSTTASLLSV